MTVCLPLCAFFPALLLDRSQVDPIHKGFNCRPLFPGSHDLGSRGDGQSDTIHLYRWRWLYN